MRSCGILMPVFSLGSPYGIGNFGPKAYEFVDFLEASGQTFWQILPLGSTGYGDSPYQSFSTFAGNPYFISPELLIKEKLLTKKACDAFDFGSDPERVDYGKLYENRYTLLHKAFQKFRPSPEYEAFLSRNEFWLPDYALFMALKNERGGVSWDQWEEPLRFREVFALQEAQKRLSKEIRFQCFLQYQFYRQWGLLKDYAAKRHIRIIGDLPIYVAYDSADVWAGADQFLLDEHRKPIRVAGCPPDAFSEDGQLWGNPLYRWDSMKKQAQPYSWWIRRIRFALQIYDMIRIDHFRGFESYYTIPYGALNAKAGKWVKGPGMSLFKALEKELGKDLPIIAEDLGYLTKAVHDLRDKSGFPGMKVLQFAFDSREDSDYLPHHYTKHSVCYTGTHDNDTLLGWEKSAKAEDIEYAKQYLHYTGDEGFNWTMIRAALMSVSDLCILTMQDLIGLDSSGRINTPSTTEGNWQWRIREGCINAWIAGVILENTRLYARDNKKSFQSDSNR